MRIALAVLVCAGCGGSPGAPDANTDASELDADESEPPPHVRTQVVDFDDGIVVDASWESRLTVFVAEPTYDTVADRWFISTLDLVDMDVTATLPFLTYEVDYTAGFDGTACIQVLDTGLGAPAVVRCYPAAPDDLVDHLLVAEGTLLAMETFDAIRQALGDESLDSVLIGRVIDEAGLPAAGAQVTPTFGTVQYLNDDLSSTSGLTETSASGVFVSVDARYRGNASESNLWVANRGGDVSSEVVIGGLLANKVTIVILQLIPGPNP